MLTRIRFEAQGPTPADCRDDLLAAADRLLRDVLATVYPDNQPTAGEFDQWISSWTKEEVYSALPWDKRMPDIGAVYTGRLVIGLPIGPQNETITAETFQQQRWPRRWDGTDVQPEP